jgi:O-antigen/teichoic acid export membrane protein
VSVAIAFRLSIRLKPDIPSAERNPASAGLTPQAFVNDVLPLGAAVLLSALYFRIDVYFVEHWQGLQAVGAYNAVFRLVEAMRLLPAAVMAVTFPMLVLAADTRLVQRIGAGLGAIGAVLAIACGLGAPFIVALIYGQAFLPAAPAFAILSLALPLFFLNYALTHQVIGWDGQHAYFVIVVVALIVNIAANVVLVPTQGMIGAAIATVLTEIVVTAGCISALGGRTTVSNLRVEPSLGTTVMNQRVEPSL